MRKFLFAAVAVSALTGSTYAADLPTYKSPPAFTPPVPVFSWNGFYGGVNAGGGWVKDGGDPFCINPAGTLNGTGCLTNNVPGTHVSGSGFIGGGQIGYNWQSGNLVLGVETDIQGADINGSVNVLGPFNYVGGGAPSGNSFTASEKLDWLGTARLRAGFAIDRALLYATGGLAYGGGNVSQNTIFTSEQYPSSGSFTKAGWTVGGGAEWAFANSWSAKVEGLYYDLGSVSTQGGSNTGGDAYIGGKVFDVRGEILRIGLNYKFGGP